MLPFPYSVRCGIFSVATALTGQYARFDQRPGKTLCVQRVLQNRYVLIKKPQTMLNHNALFWGEGESSPESRH